ncbi:hypothetical protein Tco_0825965, partial [Tanacetum coccineum]
MKINQVSVIGRAAVGRAAVGRAAVGRAAASRAADVDKQTKKGFGYF